MLNNSSDSYLGKRAYFFVYSRKQNRIALNYFALNGDKS